MKIGEVIPKNGEIVINEGKETVTVIVKHTGDRPVQVGSHFHFFEVNRQLEFDRALAYGYHLDIPSGTSVRFEPGEEKAEISLLDVKKSKDYRIFNRYRNRDRFREDSFFYV